MRNSSLAGAALVLLMAVPVRPAGADVWDEGGDDAFATTRNELVHGADQVHDLAARPGPVADVDWYRVAQRPLASYEVVVDATSGDLGASGPVLERVGSDGVSVLQTSVPAGAGTSRALRFENFGINPITNQGIRVRSAGCGSNCGSDATYRVRLLETTASIPRFSNSGSQITVVLLQNLGPGPADGHINFWNGAGQPIFSEPFSLPPHGTYVFNSSAALPGASGSITVSHTGGYGQLAGRATAIEPATGFTFDTVLGVRPAGAQGSAGGRGSAALVMTPVEGDFGTVFLPGGSHRITFTVRNLGGTASGILSTSLSGPDTAQFGVTADSCAGSSLPTGAFCTLDAAFSPVAAGPRSAVLHVSSSTGPAVASPLSGTGVTGNPVFVTSATYDPVQIMGLMGADAKCQASASAGGLPPGTYRAWLSTSSVDARTRLASARGFLRTDGTPFADAQSDFLDNNRVLNSVRNDESGAPVAGSTDVWTGTGNAGTVATLTCGDWTSNNPAVLGTAGTTEGGPVAWTLYSFPSCAMALHLYCFGTDANVAVSIPAAGHRYAFLSLGTFAADSGIAAADALCVSEAGGLPGTYKAYLATSTASAASRFNLAAGPYMRRDFQVVGGETELDSFTPLESGIWQYANTAYVSGTTAIARSAWTGAATPGVAGSAATTCDDWSSTAGTGYIGDPALDSPFWFGWAAGQACNLPRHVYCLQE